MSSTQTDLVLEKTLNLEGAYLMQQQQAVEESASVAIRIIHLSNVSQAPITTTMLMPKGEVRG